MAQNRYDDEDFFAAYSRLQRSIHGLAAAPEWQTLRKMLPDLSGRRVLDLGCGFGWFCRWAVEVAGAEHAMGFDLSERMLERAAVDTAGELPVDYVQADLEWVDLPTERFDLAYSSLTLHYVVGLQRLVERVHDALHPTGSFVFSVEHPIATAPSSASFLTTDDGRSVWPLNQYLEEGPRVTDWLAPGVVKQHRTVASYVRTLLDTGFHVRELVEWGPSPQQVIRNADWAKERERPAFLLVRADRPAR